MNTTRTAMESRVENWERSLLEWRKENQTRLEEIKRLWKTRKGYFRHRSRRDHAPTRHRRPPTIYAEEEGYGRRAGERKLEILVYTEGKKVLEEEKDNGSAEELLEADETDEATERGPRKHMISELLHREGTGKEGELSDQLFMPTKMIGKRVGGGWFMGMGGGYSRNDDACCIVGGVGKIEGDLGNSGGGRCEGGGRGSGKVMMVGGGRVRPPELRASMEEGGSSTMVEFGVLYVLAKLRLPKPPDLDVPKAEVGSSFEVTELPLSTPPSVPPDPWPCLAAVKGGREVMPLPDIFVLMKMRGGAECEWGYFFNLTGQAQQGIEGTLELGGEDVFHPRIKKHSEIAEYGFGPKLIFTQPISIDFIAEVFIKPKGIKGTKIEWQPKEGDFKPCTGVELLETMFCFRRTKGNLLSPSSVFTLGEAWRRIRTWESTREYAAHLRNRRKTSETMRYFVLTESDLDEWYCNPEAFHHEQDMWPCAAALYNVLFENNSQLLGPVVVSLLQETMNSCLTSVTEITPALLLKDSTYGAAAYVYYELSNYLSFKDWFNGGAFSLELSHEHPNLRIIHHKVAVILGQWVSEIKDDTKRPEYYALIRLLQGRDLRCTASCHIEDAKFLEREFVDLFPIFWYSCYILFEVQELDSKVQVLNLIFILIGHVSELIPFANKLVLFFQEVWEESSGESLLQIQLLVALRNFVVALGYESPICYNILLPILERGIIINSPDELNLLEDSMLLWEATLTLSQVPSMVPQLLSYFSGLVEIMERSFDHLQVAVNIIEDYIILGGIDFLSMHATNIAIFAIKDEDRGTNALLRQDWVRINSQIKVGVKEWGFKPTHSKQWDPGGHYYATCISWSLCFQLWDPGGRLFVGCFLYLHLEDKINHSARVTTEDHAYEIKGAAGLFSWDYLFSLRSPLSLKAGEQVYIQYDLKKSNAELALDYGFIEPNADRNAYTLTLQISESDPFFDDKLDIAESNGFGETAYFDIFFNRPLPPGLLPYLRLVALGGTDAFLLESLFRNSIWGHLELSVSRDNEELICRVVREACKSALASYHTTIEEDNKLKEANLDSRLAIAVGVREGEKKVLQQIDEIFKEKELELDQLEYYQERRLKDLGLCGESGDILGDLEKFF